MNWDVPAAITEACLAPKRQTDEIMVDWVERKTKELASWPVSYLLCLPALLAHPTQNSHLTHPSGKAACQPAPLPIFSAPPSTVPPPCSMCLTPCIVALCSTFQVIRQKWTAGRIRLLLNSPPPPAPRIFQPRILDQKILWEYYSASASKLESKIYQGKWDTHTHPASSQSYKRHSKRPLVLLPWEGKEEGVLDPQPSVCQEY